MSVLLDRPRAERLALSPAVTRVSEKLHRRTARRTVPFAVAVALEVAAFGAGAALIVGGRRTGSSAAAVAGTLLWVAALEPLVKVAAGAALGIRFSHAYVLGVEPRFKMRYGTYVAAPASARVGFHLAGLVGSPLGAWLAGRLACERLPAACTVAHLVFAFVTAVNASLLLAGVAGAQRWTRAIELSSGGAAGAEIRRFAARMR